MRLCFFSNFLYTISPQISSNQILIFTKNLVILLARYISWMLWIFLKKQCFYKYFSVSTLYTCILYYFYGVYLDEYWIDVVNYLNHIIIDVLTLMKHFCRTEHWRYSDKFKLFQGKINILNGELWLMNNDGSGNNPKPGLSFGSATLGYLINGEDPITVFLMECSQKHNSRVSNNCLSSDI